MAEHGFRSVLDGSCVASLGDAAAGACAGYPRSFVAEGGERQTATCTTWEVDESTVSADYFVLSDVSGVVDHYSVQIAPNWCQVAQSPWELSVADGVEVVWLVAGVWFLGWCARVGRVSLA